MFRNPELRSVAHQLRSYYAVAGLFSLAVNLLYLAGPIYMLQVYDRVMSSGSVTTLVMLSLILLLAYFCLAGLDMVRGCVLNRAGLRMDALLSQRLLLASLERPESRSQPLRDLDTIRQFATGGGVQALFDLPWVPIYLIVLFLLHPLLGTFALISSVDGAAAPHPGEAIYVKLCQECHGRDGQGVEGKYDEPLVGDRTLEAAWSTERQMALTLLLSLCGLFAAAFFLSRSYMVVLYLIAAMVAGYYVGARRRWPELPMFRLSEGGWRWVPTGACSVFALFVLVAFLLRTT